MRLALPLRNLDLSFLTSLLCILVIGCGKESTGTFRFQRKPIVYTGQTISIGAFTSVERAITSFDMSFTNLLIKLDESHFVAINSSEAVFVSKCWKTNASLNKYPIRYAKYEVSGAVVTNRVIEGFGMAEKDKDNKAEVTFIRAKQLALIDYKPPSHTGKVTGMMMDLGISGGVQQLRDSGQYMDTGNAMLNLRFRDDAIVAFKESEGRLGLTYRIFAETEETRARISGKAVHVAYVEFIEIVK